MNGADKRRLASSEGRRGSAPFAHARSRIERVG